MSALSFVDEQHGRCVSAVKAPPDPARFDVVGNVLHLGISELGIAQPRHRVVSHYRPWVALVVDLMCQVSSGSLSASAISWATPFARARLALDQQRPLACRCSPGTSSPPPRRPTACTNMTRCRGWRNPACPRPSRPGGGGSRTGRSGLPPGYSLRRQKATCRPCRSIWNRPGGLPFAPPAAASRSP